MHPKLPLFMHHIAPRQVTITKMHEHSRSHSCETDKDLNVFRFFINVILMSLILNL